MRLEVLFVKEVRMTNKENIQFLIRIIPLYGLYLIIKDLFTLKSNPLLDDFFILFTMLIYHILLPFFIFTI